MEDTVGCASVSGNDSSVVDGGNRNTQDAVESDGDSILSTQRGRGSQAIGKIGRVDGLSKK